jgi:hypothetical protein
MQTFLLTDYLINKIDADIATYRHGNYDELLSFIEAL